MNSQNIIAENHSVITKQLFYEGSSVLQFAGYKKMVKKLALALLIICVLVAVWLLTTGGSLLYLAGESVFAAALLLWLSVILPRTVSRGNFKKMTANAENTLIRTVRFYQEHLTVSSESMHITSIPYEDLLEILETRHLWILNCKHKKAIMLKKDGFLPKGQSSTKTLPQTLLDNSYFRQKINN